MIFRSSSFRLMLIFFLSRHIEYIGNRAVFFLVAKQCPQLACIGRAGIYWDFFDRGGIR